MSNGDDQQQVNCVLGICCGLDDEPTQVDPKQIKALTEILTKNLGPGKHDLKAVAASILHSFDLAERGTLKPFKDSVAKLARGFPYEG